MSLILDEHRQYLSDRSRLEAFERAIARTVRRGDVVLDLAAGTGVLGFLACRAGASRVYAIESGGIIGVGRSLAQANGLADRIVFVRDLSTRVVLPEPVDVVVCDLTGHLGIEPGVFEYLADVKRRMLKPGGRTVPAGIRFEVAPLESDDLRGRLDFWSSRPEGIDVTPARAIAFNTGYPAHIAPSQLLGEPSVFAEAALPPDDVPTICGEASLVVSRPGRLDGLAAWCRVTLAPDVVMTNSPVDPGRIHRRQVMLPIERAVQVEPGDQVQVSMHMLPGELVVTWRVRVSCRSGVTQAFSHTTFKGMLVTAEDQVTTDPSWYPTLTPAGEARRTVLELCDGRRSLREIEAEVFRRHVTLLPTRDAAAAFVAEVLTPYGLIDRAGLQGR